MFVDIELSCPVSGNVRSSQVFLFFALGTGLVGPQLRLERGRLLVAEPESARQELEIIKSAVDVLEGLPRALAAPNPAGDGTAGGSRTGS
jgi:hypothetical protein